ncbi:ABC transporter permease [Pelosinus sp. IPA-1]|uniref:ABC transporter permease n=1 Tax=Pelosinus sp. IPA-1 TaxID=3029569 RepID=UPI0024362673|nr:ABC transporter permease [Pelosinus sp. IPA-1]GMB01114.1 peptide ABC transporter permease [Pelosinus sp. IPA-1]
MDKEVGQYTFWQRFFLHKIGNFGLGILVLFTLLAIFAPIIAPHSPVDTNLEVVRQAPQAGYWFGTDELGRDVFSRLLYGARVSLLVGISSVLLSTTIGLGFGLISGYAGGILDNIMMRLVDGLLSLPSLILVIALQSFGKQGLWSVVLVIAATNWMQTARLVRTEFLSMKQRPFVKAAVTTGTSDWNLIFRHILPNCLASVVVLATINVGHAIVTEAALSFLGLGIPPHQPSWGNMLMGGQRSILAGCWWITFFPGVMIVATVLAVNFVGDAIRDALDPLSLRNTKQTSKVS